MRRLFTGEGLSESTLGWGERTGRWRRADCGVWADGPDDPSELDRARAAVIATGGVASHHLAGVLHRLDAVTLDGTWVTLARTASGRRPHVSRRALDPQRITVVHGLRCTDGLQTMVDLAVRSTRCGGSRLWCPRSGSGCWQYRACRPGCAPGDRPAFRPRRACLRRCLCSWHERSRACPTRKGRSRRRMPESTWRGRNSACSWSSTASTTRTSLSTTPGGTAIVAATGWLCGRFTRTEVVRIPGTTARRLAALADQARLRPAGARPRCTRGRATADR